MKYRRIAEPAVSDPPEASLRLCVSIVRRFSSERNTLGFVGRRETTILFHARTYLRLYGYSLDYVRFRRVRDRLLSSLLNERFALTTRS